jgi:hypothetical protein
MADTSPSLNTYAVPFISTNTSGSPIYTDTVFQYNRTIRTLEVPTISMSFGSSYMLSISYSSPTLLITGNSTTYQFSSYSFLGSTNTVSALTISGFAIGSSTRIGLYNEGTENLTINDSGLGMGILCLYSSNITVPTLGYAYMTIDYIQ